MLAAVWTTSSRPALAANYSLDDQHTSVVFAIDHFGFSYCYGMFGGYDGSFSYDAANPSASQFKFRIDAASIDTKSAKRDEHLRGPDFFNVRQFPDITFQSTGVSVDGKTLNVTGNLTMHGVTKQIVMPLKYVGEGKGPYGQERLGFVSRMSVNRTDFGINAFAPSVGEEVVLMISFEGIKK